MKRLNLLHYLSLQESKRVRMEEKKRQQSYVSTIVPVKVCVKKVDIDFESRLFDGEALDLLLNH